jgi:hypothetical protein
MGLSSYAQVGVGTSNPDASAQLDVVSTNKGILIPRMKLTGTSDVSTIANPKESLLVYNTATAGDVVPGFYYWNSLKWVTLGGLSGNVAISSGGTGATTAPAALANLGAQSVANITTVLGTTLDHYPSESAVTAYVDAEATRATAIESGLQNQIFTEVSRATAAEATLQTAVALKAATADVTVAVAAETTRATAAELALQANIDTEATTARAAELSNSTAITTEATTARAAESTNAIAITTEATTARAAESTNAIAITTEATTARAAELLNSTAITTEAATARAAELLNSTAITTEATTARAAESTNAIAITTEATTARAAELSNSTAITNEVARATGVELLKEDKTNKTTVINGTATDVLYPSALAVKTYVDAVPSFYGADGALTTARTVTQNNNDLTFTTGTAKLVVDGTLKTTGAVISSFVTTTSNAYTVPSTLSTVIYTGVGPSTFTLPTASAANAGMEIKIINVTPDLVSSITFPSALMYPSMVVAQIDPGTACHVFCDGVLWYLYKSSF